MDMLSAAAAEAAAAAASTATNDMDVSAEETAVLHGSPTCTAMDSSMMARTKALSISHKNYDAGERPLPLAPGESFVDGNKNSNNHGDIAMRKEDAQATAMTTKLPAKRRHVEMAEHLVQDGQPSPHPSPVHIAHREVSHSQ